MSANRRIIVNSFVLYARLLLTTFIGLYASRLILIQLGVENFGLYSIVGGIVAMLNFLNTSMISTSNRFLALELGKHEANVEPINRIFNSLVLLHITFSIALLIIVETLGIWYVKTYLNIETDKISDALNVLHFSALSAVFSTVTVPFQGLLTINEKFGFKARVDTLYSILNLVAILLLVFFENKLTMYAFLVFFIQFIVFLLYYFMCQKHYRNVIKWGVNRLKADYVAISKFFGWQMVYVGGSVGTSQGGAMLLNSFFGTALNAAFGMAMRVDQFVFSFVKNLNQAALPQIMKSYSSGNQERSIFLLNRMSKYTFFIMLLPVVPILLTLEDLLEIWLKHVPEYTAWFIFLRLIHGLVSCLESGFDGVIDATGKIRKTKILFTFIFLSTLPVAYILFENNYPPYVITVLAVMAEIIFLIFQLGILAKLTDFKINIYIRETILPVSMVTLFVLPQYFLKDLFDGFSLSIVWVGLLSVCITIATVFWVGLSKSERNVVVSNLSNLNVFSRFKAFFKSK